MADEEEIVEPLLPEPQEILPEGEPETALEVIEEAETDAPLREPTPLEESSEEEPPPPPKRVRKARVQPDPKAKAEPKRRGRPPGARNVVRAPAPVVQQDPLEQIMTSMRERRQAHQERQHTFFQSFLPA